MIDSDNHNNADNDSDARAASDTKLNKPKRTSDIYERFLSRVQQIDSEVRESEEEQLSATERLDNRDSKSVDNPNSKDDNPNNDTDIAIEDITETTHTDISINNQLTKNVEKAKTSGTVRGRQVSSIKLLIIGVVCGLLLSASMIFLLNKTGLLAALTDNSVADSSEVLTPSVKMNAPVTSASQPTIIATADSPQEPILSANSNTITAQKASSNNAKAIQPNSDIIPESDITYEDFREEAQNTVYRETKD